MSENDEVLGLKAIKAYEHLWWSDIIVSFIVDAKEEFQEFTGPEHGWLDHSSGAVPEVLRALGGRKFLDDVETPEDLLEVIAYYKSYTNALSADEKLSKKVDCTEFVIKIYELYRRIKAKPILGEPVDQFLAPRASDELSRYQDRILQMDKSLSAKQELFQGIPTNEWESTETTAIQNNEYVFVREDDFWDITFEKQKLKPIKHQLGLIYIQYLLQNRGKIFKALDLSVLNNPVPSTNLQNKSTTSDLENESITSDPFDDSGEAGDALDKKAIGSYRARLREIPGEIDKAKKNNDTERHEELLEERQGIESNLSSSTGLHGRS